MKLCLGTVQFGMDYGIQGNGQPQEEKVFEMLSYAIDNGVEMLDTASAYGKAESVLGNYIRAFPDKAGKVNIVSKMRPDAFKENKVNLWSEIAVENARESLERLGVQKFAAYLFHNTAHIFDARAVYALNKVKEEGITDRIGVSVYSPEEAMKALEYPQVETIQIPYNLFDHRLDKFGFFKKAKEQNVLVFARSSLLQGLVMMDPNHLPDRVSFAKEYLEQFLSICSEYRMPPLKAAVGYVGSKNGIDYVVFGVDNLTQLEEYVVMKNSILPSEMMQKIENKFENVEERLVNPVLWK